MRYRIERDKLGELKIEAGNYWGIHTQRALQNFPLDNVLVAPTLIRAYALVKKAAIETNEALGYLEPVQAGAMKQACDEIASGKFADQFPVGALQGGAGTSTNMNLNEVIANRALELQGFEKGDYAKCDPLRDVNKHQSTNDTYPTALKVAAIFALRELSGSIETLQGALQRKEKAYAEIIKVGRTQLQPAVPMSLGSEFAAFAEAISRDRWRTFKCEERLRVINLGGTAIGTGLGAPRSYIFSVTDKLRAITGIDLCRAENLVDATANADVFVEVSGILAAHAATLSKICEDLRHLNAIDEINLLPLQVGSSIMPGKFNPVMLEAGIQVAMAVMSGDAVITQCVARGSLQINEFLPLVSRTLLESLQLLQRFDAAFAEHVDGVTVKPEVCAEELNHPQALITPFVPVVGYEKAQALMEGFDKSGQRDLVKYLIAALGEELVRKTLDVSQIMKLGFEDENT